MIVADPNQRPSATPRPWFPWLHLRGRVVNTIPRHGWGWRHVLAVWCGRGQAGGDPLGPDAQLCLAARWWRGEGPKYANGSRAVVEVDG